MIDIVKSENEFKKYLEQYDQNDEMVKAKIVHTYDVVNCSEILAKNLKLSQEDAELSKLIALLHDIGRFEQASSNAVLYDKAELVMNHALYGVKVLFEDGLIRNFIQTDAYDNVIYKAIENHNKLKIEDGLNEKELLHAKLIRDNDKTGNIVRNRVRDFKVFLGTNDLDILENEIISYQVFEDFMNKKTIDIKHRKTALDRWIGCIAFVFDYNFKESLQYLYDNNYINELFDRINYKNPDTKNKIEIMQKFANEYIEEKIK